MAYMDGTWLTGTISTDRVCPSDDEQSCSIDQQFVALTRENGLSDYEDGILGLWSGGKTGYDNAEMLMPGLFADSTITENVFSFYMTGLDGASYIDFGAVDPSIVTDPNETFWLDITSENLWWS